MLLLGVLEEKLNVHQLSDKVTAEQLYKKKKKKKKEQRGWGGGERPSPRARQETPSPPGKPCRNPLQCKAPRRPAEPAPRTAVGEHRSAQRGWEGEGCEGLKSPVGSE